MRARLIFYSQHLFCQIFQWNFCSACSWHEPEPQTLRPFQEFFCRVFCSSIAWGDGPTISQQTSNTSVVEVCFVVEGEKSRISMDLLIYRRFFLDIKEHEKRSRFWPNSNPRYASRVHPPLTPTPVFGPDLPARVGRWCEKDDGICLLIWKDGWHGRNGMDTTWLLLRKKSWRFFFCWVHLFVN